MMRMDEMVSCLLAFDGGRIQIGVAQRERADSDDFWDRNWLIGRIHARFGEISWAKAITLHATELASFLDGASLVKSRALESASFRPMEADFGVSISAEVDDSFCVRFSYSSEDPLSVTLTASSSTEQRLLEEFITTLKEVMFVFPVVGEDR
jgi:hypothetical protein